MQLVNNNNLIGDLTGTVNIMIDLAKKHGGLNVHQTLEEGRWIYDLIPDKYNIKLIQQIDCSPSANVLITDIGAAFNYSQEHGTYMSQSWHDQFGLPTPAAAPPDLDIPDVDVPVYDYIFAPFSRSTPDNQKWHIGHWIDLEIQLKKKGYSVCFFGNSEHDQPINITAVNLEYDRPMIEVLNILKKCRKGCISINTGISHLCYATNTKNYLLNNQGQGWAVQPNAISIETYIPRITVDEMLDFIQNN